MPFYMMRGLHSILYGLMWPLSVVGCVIWVSNEDPIYCTVGTFGAYLDSGINQSYSLLLPTSSYGCDLVGAAPASILDWRQGHAALGNVEREEGLGVLLPRGQCSFFAKAAWAEAATVNLTHGSRLLVVADTVKAKGQAASAALVPAIAEWDRFDHGRGLTVVGISAADGRLLRTLAEAETGTTAASEPHLSTNEKASHLRVVLGSSSSKEGAKRRIDQCATRAFALLQGGLVTRAAALLDDCATETVASARTSSAGEEDTAAREHLMLVEVLHEAGLHGAAEQWIQALALHGNRSKISQGILGSCYAAACQAHLRNGRAALAHDACSSAHSLLFHSNSSPLEDSSTLSQVMSSARLASLDFLLAGDLQDDCDTISSENPNCNTSRVKQSTATTAAGAARAAAEQWQVASEAYRALRKSTGTPSSHDANQPLPSSTQQQQQPLQNLPSSLAAALSTAKSSGDGGGVGDATVWLLFTLIDEAAGLQLKLKATTTTAVEAAAQAVEGANSSQENHLNADTGVAADSTSINATAAYLLAACVDGRTEIEDNVDKANHVLWPFSSCGCLRRQTSGNYTKEEAEFEAHAMATIAALKDARVPDLLLRLMDVHATLALFLDEVGVFAAADSHLSIATGLASRACRSDLAMGLRLRRAAATPTVATSNETMHRHRIEQLRQLQALPSILQAQTYEGPQDEDQLPSTHTSSSSTDVSSVVSFSDPLLAYTVTPSSMMIGYQGSDDPIATHALALAYARSDPSLSKVAPHLQLFESTSEQPGDAEGARRRSSISISETQNRGVVRVGFVSSYLRHHSVGRLMAGIIERLDSNQVEAHVFLATHFFKAHIIDHQNMTTFQDPLTARLAAALGSDRVHVLPPPIPNSRREHGNDNRETSLKEGSQTDGKDGKSEDRAEPPTNMGRPSAAALAMVANAQLDVLVYPELGMDAITVLMAMLRLAPIQMVFWGHPISQGLNSIDYFVSSDFYEPPNGEMLSSYTTSAADPAADTLVNQAVLSPSSQQRWGGGGGLRYHEQLIRMNGLGVYFERPRIKSTAATGATGAKSTKDAHRERVSTLSKFGLPADCHLFFVPQTLMKFHPSFDEALANLLLKDPAAVVVITYSGNQPAWQAQLERRLASTLKRKQASASSTRSSTEATAAAAAAAAARAAIAAAADEVNLESNATVVLTSARVRFLPSLEHAAFLNLLQHAHAVLDPWPFGGGVTSLEALSVGVPVVTLPSRQSVVQLAAGFYRRMSLESEGSENFDSEPPLNADDNSNRTYEMGIKPSSSSSSTMKRAQNEEDKVAPRDVPWPIATNEDDFVEIAVAIATSMEKNYVNSNTKAQHEKHPLGLEDGLKRRILATHGVLYEDESAAVEWTRLLVQLGRAA